VESPTVQRRLPPREEEQRQRAAVVASAVRRDPGQLGAAGHVRPSTVSLPRSRDQGTRLKYRTQQTVLDRASINVRPTTYRVKILAISSHRP